MKKFKGKKFYTTLSTDYDSGCEVAYQNKETAIDKLNQKEQILVELTVTRVFTRERDLKEIETEL